MSAHKPWVKWRDLLNEDLLKRIFRVLQFDDSKDMADIVKLCIFVRLLLKMSYENKSMDNCANESDKDRLLMFQELHQQH